jgi:alkylresorcinol/alkylpyrone synthase
LKFGTRRGICAASQAECRLAAEHAALVLEEARRSRVSRAAIAPDPACGRPAIAALQGTLGVSAEDLATAPMLREYGNMSSAFVYFVLQAALADDAPAGLWWLSAFGAGFSCHGALLEVA